MILERAAVRVRHTRVLTPIWSFSSCYLGCYLTAVPSFYPLIIGANKYYLLSLFSELQICI